MFWLLFEEPKEGFWGKHCGVMPKAESEFDEQREGASLGSQASAAAVTEYHRLGDLQTVEVSSHSFRDWEIPMSKILADSESSGLHLPTVSSWEFPFGKGVLPKSPNAFMP